MFELLAYILFTLFIGLLIIIFIYGRSTYGMLEEMNIPIIKPYLLFGSRPMMHKMLIHEEDQRDTKRLGKIWGMYEGKTPFVFVSDIELVKLIFIKDFDHFHDKRSFDIKIPLINEMLDMLPGEKWKAIRNSLTPTFTTGKIKLMSKLIFDACKDSADYLHEELKESNEKTFNYKDFYVGLTADVIARTVFAIKVDSMRDPDNQFLKNINKLNFDQGDEMNFFLTVAMTFPIMMDWMPGMMDPKTIEYWGDILNRIVKERQDSGVVQNDFVDTVVELLKELDSPEFKRLGIVRESILAQSLFFLIAGFETTANTLTLLSYHLAKDEKIQNKVLEEVDKFYAKHSETTYSNLAELPYLNACIHETLRMYPPLIRVERNCMKDWSDPEGRLSIKKGITVQVPVYTIHHDPEYYPDPYKFNPERFMPENKDQLTPYTFLTFGLGPHNCIGNRFAFEVLKMAMANILRDFKFQPTDETKLKFMKGRIFLTKHEVFKGNIVKRNKI